MNRISYENKIQSLCCQLPKPFPYILDKIKYFSWITLVLFGLCLFVPTAPLIVTDYYEYIMHLAVEKGWQYGTQLLSNYGPLGFIGLPFYHPSTFVIMIAANLILFLLSVLLLWHLWKVLVDSGRPSAIWLVISILLPSIVIPPYWGTILFTPYLLINGFVWLHTLQNRITELWLSAILTALMSLLVLIKGTFVGLVLVAVGIVTIDQYIRFRRAPLVPVIFFASLASFWLLARQKIENLPVYFSGISEFISGYKDVFALETNYPIILMLLYIIAAGMLLAGFVAPMASKHGWVCVCGPAFVLLLTLYVIFQHGFVRSDVAHVMPACFTLGSLSIFCFPMLWKASSGKPRYYVLQIGASVSSLVLMVMSTSSGFERPISNVLLGKIEGAWKLMSVGYGFLDKTYFDNQKKLRSKYALYNIKSPIDCGVIDAGIADAYKIDSTTRPTSVLFAATTTKLAVRNKNYITNSAGPATVLLPSDTNIDQLYPAMVDAAEYVSLKAYFNASAIYNGVIVLKRRDKPLKYNLNFMEQHQVNIGETILVPGNDNEIIWAKINIEPTAIGKLTRLVYKPFPVYIVVNMKQDKKIYRIVPELSRDGLILSPMLSGMSGAWFYGIHSLSPKHVEYFKIQSSLNTKFFYRERISVIFYKIEFKE